jgi:hypothetical protein
MYRGVAGALWAAPIGNSRLLEAFSSPHSTRVGIMARKRSNRGRRASDSQAKGAARRMVERALTPEDVGEAPKAPQRARNGPPIRLGPGPLVDSGGGPDRKCGQL